MFSAEQKKKSMAENTKYEVRVVKAEADGVAPSLILCTPPKGPEYVFNVPEGFSRLVLGHKVRPSARLASVFLTSLRPRSAGGLSGLLLRLAADGHGQLQLFGPHHTSEFVYSLRHIIYWRHPKVFVCDCTLSGFLPIYEDDFVTVYPIQIGNEYLPCHWCLPRNSESENKDLWKVNNVVEKELPKLPEGVIPLYTKLPPKSSVISTEEIFKQNHDETNCSEGYSPLMGKSLEILGYLCYLRKLQTSFLVISCESPSLASELKEHRFLSCISSSKSSNSDSGHKIVAIFHLSATDVLNSEQYKSWIAGLDDDILHVTMGDDPCEYGFLRSFQNLVRMNMINKETFPLPFNVLQEKQKKEEENKGYVSIKKIRTARMLTCVTFQRNLEGEVQTLVDGSACKRGLNVRQIQEHVAQIWDVPIMESIKVENDALEFSKTKPVETHKNKKDGSHFNLHFLGTGSSEPSQNRGSSGILLQVKANTAALLLDAGEGTVGQICRSYGKSNLQTIINSVKCVWISHKHADHVVGLISIIASRSNDASVLLVVGSTPVKDWLSEVNRIYCRLGYMLPHFSFVHCKEFMLEDQQPRSFDQRSRDAVSRIFETLELESMKCVWVNHCFQACGVVLSSIHGWSVVYSGDTRPCEKLIQAGNGCTLVIHEATFEDHFENHAIEKRHSTIAEAIEVGCKMGAQNIILTHFSNRSPMALQGDYSHEHISFAYDGMVVSSSNLCVLPRITGYLVDLFEKIERDSPKLSEVEALQSAGMDNAHAAVPSKPDALIQTRVSAGNHKRRSSCDSDDDLPQAKHLKETITIEKYGSKHIRWNYSDSEEE